jgi:hypothetical protein
MKSKLEIPKIPLNLPALSQQVFSLKSKDEFSMGTLDDITIDNQKASKVSFEKNGI